MSSRVASCFYIRVIVVGCVVDGGFSLHFPVVLNVFGVSDATSNTADDTVGSS